MFFPLYCRPFQRYPPRSRISNAIHSYRPSPRFPPPLPPHSPYFHPPYMSPFLPPYPRPSTGPSPLPPPSSFSYFTESSPFPCPNYLITFLIPPFSSRFLDPLLLGLGEELLGCPGMLLTTASTGAGSLSGITNSVFYGFGIVPGTFFSIPPGGICFRVLNFLWGENSRVSLL